MVDDMMDAAELTSLIGYGQQLIQGVQQVACQPGQPGLSRIAKKAAPGEESMQQGTGNPTAKGMRPPKLWSIGHIARRNHLFRVLATLPCKVCTHHEELLTHAS